MSIFFPVWQQPDLTYIHQCYQKDIRTEWISPPALTQIPTHSCVKIASEKGTGESSTVNPLEEPGAWAWEGKGQGEEKRRRVLKGRLKKTHIYFSDPCFTVT
ncbi:unnamed protein product [Tetraodon nigroviridis]|uniref:(spotted green pufferfish) hypothetical protein n=1 Tax=Tetraodon nigroviridis TaxID=99883 RepID=Q4T174_TETNG|nr:unnamed protein product [Tetraodon nigroviridis]